jgi:hypothetical protein
LGRLELAQPLASQDLGAITHDVAITMLQEIDGWVKVSVVVEIPPTAGTWPNAGSVTSRIGHARIGNGAVVRHGGWYWRRRASDAE